MRIPLEQLKIAEPCHEDWNAMTGNAQRRFCAACNKQVHDISRMSRSEAEELVCRSAGALCIRMEVDHALNVVTLDYAKPPRRSRWPIPFALTAVIALVAALLGFGRVSDPQAYTTMGSVLLPDD